MSRESSGSVKWKNCTSAATFRCAFRKASCAGSTGASPRQPGSRFSPGGSKLALQGGLLLFVPLSVKSFGSLQRFVAKRPAHHADVDPGFESGHGKAMSKSV